MFELSTTEWVSIGSAIFFAVLALLSAIRSFKKDKLAVDKLVLDADAAKALAATNVLGLAGVLSQMLSNMEEKMLKAVSDVSAQLVAHARSDEENIAKVYHSLEAIKDNIDTPKIVTSTPVTRIPPSPPQV